MQFGLVLPTFEQIATRDAIVRASQLAEAQGWDSVWVTDHVLMGAGQEHPYGHIYEAITTLAYVGALTQRVKLGTSIIVLPQRNAIVVAKEAATIDALTQGRVILGVAAGWNEREFNFLSANFKRRGRHLEEAIAVMRALWSQAHPSYEGRCYQFANTLFSPKPAQAGGIPIWLGGNSDAAARRAGRIADGWQLTGMPVERVTQGLQVVRSELNGRPFTVSVRIEVDLAGKLPTEFAGPDGSKRCRLGGSTTMARDIEAYQQAGVQQMVLVFPDNDLDTFVEQVTSFATDVMPRFQAQGAGA